MRKRSRDDVRTLCVANGHQSFHRPQAHIPYAVMEPLTSALTKTTASRLATRPLLVSAQHAARMLGIGRTTLYELIRLDQVPGLRPSSPEVRRDARVATDRRVALRSSEVHRGSSRRRRYASRLHVRRRSRGNEADCGRRSTCGSQSRRTRSSRGTAHHPQTGHPQAVEPGPRRDRFVSFVPPGQFAVRLRPT